MALTRERLQENESILRWDETDDPAIFYTRSAKTRREWESFGFKVTGDPFNGWRGEVPKDRVTYKPIKGAK